MSASFKVAFPDLNYHFRVIGAEQDVVSSTEQLTGTHTGDFDLRRMMDMGVTPATNKSFATQPQKARITIEEGKITSWAVEPTRSAGVMAILQQLDIYITDMVVARQMWPIITHSRG
jgi:hypothetical protein